MDIMDKIFVRKMVTEPPLFMASVPPVSPVRDLFPAPKGAIQLIIDNC